jgi:hypothetical protein
MKNVIATVAITAAFAMPAFADTLPLNSDVTGGQGVASVAGQGLVLGGALAGGTITAMVVVGAMVLVTITNDDGTTSTTTVAI